MALFSLKLWENAFQTIPNISCFDVEKKNRRNFWIEKSVFRYFGQVFEELQPNGPQNLIARQILLQIHMYSALYEPWGSFLRVGKDTKTLTSMEGSRFLYPHHSVSPDGQMPGSMDSQDSQTLCL